jgi:cardiolipin synthase
LGGDLQKISNYNIANLLTLFRILLVPVFVILMLNHEDGWALLAFVIASATDWVDGLAARKLNLRTELGAFLDPLADKLLVLAAFVMLSLTGQAPLWMTVTAFSRDVLVVSGFIILSMVKGLQEVKPSWWGKIAIFLQMAVLGAVLLGAWLDLARPQQQALVYALGFAVVFNFSSGLDYAVRGILQYDQKKKLRT